MGYKKPPDMEAGCSGQIWVMFSAPRVHPKHPAESRGCGLSCPVLSSPQPGCDVGMHLSPNTTPSPSSPKAQLPPAASPSSKARGVGQSPVFQARSELTRHVPRAAVLIAQPSLFTASQNYLHLHLLIPKSRSRKKQKEKKKSNESIFRWTLPCPPGALERGSSSSPKHRP